MPLNMSLTMFCAARPMATPATPAEASSGARLKPIESSACRQAMTAMMARPVARMTPAIVLTSATAYQAGAALFGNADHAGGDDAQ